MYRLHDRAGALLAWTVDLLQVASHLLARFRCVYDHQRSHIAYLEGMSCLF